jgi:hypothetical protein
MLGAMAATDLTVTDVVAGGPVVAVAVVATVSLAWAHAHHHSLPAVLLTSLAVLGLLVFGVGRRVRVVWDRGGLLAVLGCGALAAALFLPGFSYGVGDKDPGVYNAHAVAIARTGSYSFTDPALAHPTLPVVEDVANARLPAIWVRNHETGLIVPQFFHLWPALLATAYDIGGYGGLTATTPLVGVCAVMALCGLLRRVAGVPAALAGGVLLATNMLEVWQAKFSTTEMLAQALYVGALLCVVVAVQTRRRGAAFLAGLLTGVGFLNRADAWLLVMVAVALLAALWVSRLADGFVWWGAAGLGVVLPYALVQAYGTAHRYTIANGVPGGRRTTLLLGLLVAGALAGRVVLRRPVRHVLDRAAWPGFQRRAGLALCAVFALLLVVGLLRTRLFGIDYGKDAYGAVARTYDEQNVKRLGWFVTLPGYALAGLGIATVALRRWRADAWVAVAPTLLLAPFFLWHAHNSVRLMWWTRRYVPHVLPGLVVLIALALAWAWDRRPLRIPAALVAVALAGVFLSQSLPLRGHDEWHGSFGIDQRISALSGDARGVYLWARGPCCADAHQLFATPVWLERGELSVLLPARAEWVPYVRAYRAAFPTDPLFLVIDGAQPPPAELQATSVDHLTGTMPFWEESNDHRPDHERRIPYDVTVWQVL